MIKKLLFISSFFCVFSGLYAQEQYIARQGQVSFFSYTKVENIEAVNNQAQSLLDLESGEIAVRILMRAFSFKKALMQEHFNESYMESDLYPEATFEGKIADFDPTLKQPQTRIVEGVFTLRDIARPLSFKLNIVPNETAASYQITGDVFVQIDDYHIKVPTLLKPNIAKRIKVTFTFDYSPYED